MYSRTPLIRKLFFRTANYPDRLGSSGKFVENSTKLTCLEITCSRIKYSTVLWLTELQIRPDRKVQTQIHTVNSNSITSNCQCRIFSHKNQITRICCISARLAVSINPLNAELNPICHLLALLGAHHILHVSRIRVNPDKKSSTVQC